MYINMKYERIHLQQLLEEGHRPKICLDCLVLFGAREPFLDAIYTRDLSLDKPILKTQIHQRTQNNLLGWCPMGFLS